MAALPWMTRGIRAIMPLIEKAAVSGLTQTAAISALRSEGFSFRDSAFRQAYRYYLAGEGVQGYVASLTKNQNPDPAQFRTAAGKIRRTYSFRVKAQVVDAQTGQLLEREITVSSDTLLTKAQIEEQALEAIEEGPERYGTDVRSIAFHDALVRSDLGTVQ